MKYILSALLLALLTNKATAFWQQGHLMVARIAYNHLEQEAPQALKAANDVLGYFKSAHPELTKTEGNFPFVECATFADDIKGKGGAFQSGWHFIDTPYLDQGGRIEDYPQFKFEDKHIANVIPAIVDWLQGSAGYQNTFVYETITQHVENEEEAKSYALRLLIHYLGDIHQPLHATSRVDKQYPKGDRGGNSFTVPAKYTAKNLHSVWDSVVYDFPDTPHMPYNSADWGKLGNTVNTLQARYNLPNDEFNSIDVEKWSNESFELSKTNVYANAKENEALSDEYVKTNQDVIERQIVLGGLRLATTIKQIYGNKIANLEEIPSIAFLQ